MKWLPVLYACLLLHLPGPPAPPDMHCVCQLQSRIRDYLPALMMRKTALGGGAAAALRAGMAGGGAPRAQGKDAPPLGSQGRVLSVAAGKVSTSDLFLFVPEIEQRPCGGRLASEPALSVPWEGLASQPLT